MTSAYLGYSEIEVKQLESVLFQLQVVIVLFSICKMIFLLGFVPKQETPGINPMVKFDNSVSFVNNYMFTIHSYVAIGSFGANRKV